MTKAEIFRAVADSTARNKKVVAAVCNAFFEIKEMLVSGGNVEIAGFGKFKVVERKEKTGRNPRTGEKIIIPAHKRPIFSATKKFNDAVNGK